MMRIMTCTKNVLSEENKDLEFYFWSHYFISTQIKKKKHNEKPLNWFNRSGKSSALSSMNESSRINHTCAYEPRIPCTIFLFVSCQTWQFLVQSTNVIHGSNYLDFFVLRLYSMNLYLLCCSSNLFSTASADSLFSLCFMKASTSSYNVIIHSTILKPSLFWANIQQIHYLTCRP